MIRTDAGLDEYAWTIRSRRLQSIQGELSDGSLGGFISKLNASLHDFINYQAFESRYINSVLPNVILPT